MSILLHSQIEDDNSARIVYRRDAAGVAKGALCLLVFGDIERENEESRAQVEY
jgi:hypothetical protein